MLARLSISLIGSPLNKPYMPLAPAGDGHFSPVGGYHADKDLVLVLDTARFKYPPHWVPLADLYMAMAPADPATGKPRGYISLSANPRSKSVMFTLDRSNRSYLEPLYC